MILAPLALALAVQLNFQAPDPKPAPPLKCEKYQHEQKTPAHCANTCPPDGTMCISQCLFVAAEDKCVDDMHMVTEREWQELQEWREFVDALRREQCPSLSWVGGRCLPFCDENPAGSSCAIRPKKEANPK